MKSTVVKIGGSLESLEGYGCRINQFLDALDADQKVIVVGGGKRVDEIRKISQLENWSDERSHWAAIDQLSQNATFASSSLNQELINCIQPLTQKTKGCVVFDCAHWLKECDLDEERPLPCSWEVTSDSIALKLALDIKADQLLLLKSVCPEQPFDVARYAELKIVDAYFPDLWTSRSHKLKLEIVNFLKVVNDQVTDSIARG